MDTKITGEFISLLRKEKNLTQKQLADKLNVSDKAISRWETGRGYPDIESLQALSDEFSVSINELLCGKRLETPAMVRNAEKVMAAAYIKRCTKKQHGRDIAIALAVSLVFIAVVSTVVFSILYKKVMGSPNCVIASDYSYMTLFGSRYVPLELDGAECELSSHLIDEAQVEGEVFIGKLLFGDQIYSVKQCANNDIVYLQTDYNPIVSNYYCLESKAEEYRNIARDTAYDRWSAEIWTEGGNTYNWELNGALKQTLINSEYKISSEIDCGWSRGEGDESVTVYSFQSDGPFRRAEGELLQKQGEYYWFDYDDIPATQDNGDFSGIRAYEIDDSHDKELDALFSYMFK